MLKALEMNDQTEENLKEIKEVFGAVNLRQMGSKNLVRVETSKGPMLICPFSKTVKKPMGKGIKYKNLRNWLKFNGIEALK